LSSNKIEEDVPMEAHVKEQKISREIRPETSQQDLDPSSGAGALKAEEE
jgi:hypothetical protein